MKTPLIIGGSTILIAITLVIIFVIISTKPTHPPTSGPLPTPTLSPESADLKRDQDKKTLRQLLEVYRLDKGFYPSTIYDLFTSPKLAPLDPANDQPYEYQVRDSGLDYQLCLSYVTKSKECLSSRRSPD